MSVKGFKFTALTGGGTGALDGQDGATLSDGDIAIVMYNDIMYFYQLDELSGAPEVVPDVIAPDNNAGDKRWILQRTPVDGQFGTVENDIINGWFDIWQRGTSQTSYGYGSDDRWSNEAGGGSTRTHEQVAFANGQTDVPDAPRYFSRTTITSGGLTNSFGLKIQRIKDWSRWSGKRVCVQLWAKADTAGLKIAIEGVQGTNTDGNITTRISVQQITLDTVWQEFTVYMDFPDVSTLSPTAGAITWNGLFLWFDAGSDYDDRTGGLGHQSGTFDIANVRAYVSDEPMPVRRRTAEEELALCQAYYCKTYGKDVVPGTVTNQGKAATRQDNPTARTVIMFGMVSTPVEMIQVPAVTLYNPVTGESGKVDVSGTSTSASPNYVNSNCFFSALLFSTGLAQNSAVYAHAVADAEL